VTTMIDGSQVHPGDVWSPHADSFDQFMIHNPTDLSVEINIHSEIPLAFCKPMLDMAGQYAPIILGVQLPGANAKDHYLQRTIFHQCVPRYDLSKLLSLIEEDESGWIRDGNTLVSGAHTEISPEDVLEVAEEHCRLLSVPSTADEEPSEAQLAEPAESIKQKRLWGWRSPLLFGAGLLIGTALGLAF